MSFEEVRKLVGLFQEMPDTLPPERRGPMVGAIGQAIRGAATSAGIEYSGQFDEARYKLASDVFQKQVSSYNELSGRELTELHRWATTKGLDLKKWLIDRYGAQTRMGI
jgi:hypothetical protein